MTMRTDYEIIMLGTGDAHATKCYNTCFILKDRNDLLLTDAGGGNGVLTQIEKAGICLNDIHDMYLTHAHTDHVLGAVWMVRFVAEKQLNGSYHGTMRVYGHSRVLHILESICRMTLSAKALNQIGKGVLLTEVGNGDTFDVGGMRIECFDIFSTKEKQFGYRARLSCGQTVVCLGDEPYNRLNRSYAEHADWLMSEAFCLYRDRDIFKPYEKSHSTALEAGAAAAELGARHLIIYHTEDSNLAERRRLYTEDARTRFSGDIIVPDDLETIRLA